MAPSSDPINACEELVSGPFHQVMRFQTMAAMTVHKTVTIVMDVASTTPCRWWRRPRSPSERRRNSARHRRSPPLPDASRAWKPPGDGIRGVMKPVDVIEHQCQDDNDAQQKENRFHGERRALAVFQDDLQRDGGCIAVAVQNPFHVVNILAQDQRAGVFGFAEQFFRSSPRTSSPRVSRS